MDSLAVDILASQELRDVMLTVMGFLVSILLGVLAWIGNRMHNRLDEISKSLGSIDKDLRESINHVDRRVARLEGFHDRKDD